MNYTNTTKYMIVAAVFAVALLVVTGLPGSASANYNNYRPYQYVVTYSQPEVVVQPPVYVQQPVIQQPVYVQQPVYIQQPVYVAPLTVSCSANNYNNGYNGSNYNYNTNYNTYNNGYSNTSVTWTAYATGGNGNYTYSWSGSDNLYGTGQSVYFNYSYAGSKYAYVTVYSNGQSVTQSCNTYISAPTYVQPIVQQPVYVRPVYQQPNYNLDIGCYADPTNAKINQPMTWSAEVTGGMAPYTYSWTGSDNLYGTQSSVIKYYSTSGSKSAIVTVTSADGRTATRACSNSLTIASGVKTVYKAPAKTVCQPCQVQSVNTTQQPTAVNNNVETAAAAGSLFSLSNVPWGWVAILVILVLFVTVMYLLLNRQKI